MMLVLPDARAEDEPLPRGWTFYPPGSEHSAAADQELSEEEQAFLARQSCLLDLRYAEQAVADALLGLDYSITITASLVRRAADGVGCSLTVRRTVEYEESQNPAAGRFASAAQGAGPVEHPNGLFLDHLIEDPCRAGLEADARAAEILADYAYVLEFESHSNDQAAQDAGCHVLTRRSVEITDR